MAFDKDAYVERKKAKKARQKANKKKATTDIAGSSVRAPGKPVVTDRRARPVGTGTADERKSMKMSPEDRAALRMPVGMSRPAEFPHLQEVVSSGEGSNPEDKPAFVDTVYKPNYKPRGAASGAKPMNLDPSHWEFMCPSCKEIKHGLQRSEKTPLGICKDCE